MRLFMTWVVILSVICTGMAVGKVKTGTPLDRPFELDHRYAPAEWQCTICLPDDWQKTVVDKYGTLLYDWPYENGGFSTQVNFGFFEGSSQWVSQNITDPQVPVVHTIKRNGDLEISLQAFAVTDQSVHVLNELAQKKDDGIIPLSTHKSFYNFASPNKEVDPEFASADVGRGSQLFYKYKARKAYVVFGFCEGFWDKEGHRVFELHIDGIRQKTVDLVKEAGKNVPFVVPLEAIDSNGDGFLEIKVKMAPGAKDNTTILNTLWIFDGLPPLEDIIQGKANQLAKARLRTGAKIPPRFTGPPRADLMLTTVRNTGKQSIKARPLLQIDTAHKLKYDKIKRTVSIRNWRHVNIWPSPDTIEEKDGTLNMIMPEVMLAPGESKEYVVSVHSNAHGFPWNVDEAMKALENAHTFWKKLNLSQNVIQVPDAAMQAQVDAAIRNIYQAREIKNGLPSFQVGPTVYRGLWIVDGAFILEAMTLLGKADETRAGVQHMLSFQKEDGSFEKLHQYWKENGIILWVIDRHEQLTGDHEWLESVWPVVEKVMDFIPVLRERSRQDPNALSYDFIPSGYSDGGLNIDHEYTNAYWIFIGLKSAIDMAHRSGRPEQGMKWQKEYDKLWERFQILAKRDLYTDEYGNRMLPIPMSRPLKKSPQKAQWALLHAIYPGEIFTQDDPIMLGTLANLTDNEKEGLVLGTGWDDEGLWNYFGSFYGHALLWLGEGHKAAQTAYAYANHAAPVLVWREEQRPQDHPHQHWVGDMPHNWASAEFLRLVLHMMVFERGDELHFLQGVPDSWFQAGKHMAIHETVTRFGKVSLELKVSENGKSAFLTVTVPDRVSPERMIIHFKGQSIDLLKYGQKKNGKIELKL